MRLHLLLLLFFVAAVLARARDRRAIGTDIANITTETAHDLINLPLTILHFISLLIRGFFDGTAKIVIPVILEPFRAIIKFIFKLLLSSL